MATIEHFIGHPVVQKSVRDAKTACQGKEISDILDANGLQYVDLVMEGGGVLGVALTGYTYVLEQAGIRFLGIGGTSAGSINALMIAALGPPEEAKSETLLRVRAEMPMGAFIDGDQDARDFSHAVLNKVGMMKLPWKAMQIMDNLTDDLGLNPGTAFFNWLTDELTQAGIRTNADLLNRLRTVPRGLRLRPSRTDADLKGDDTYGKLIMVAIGITTKTKVKFLRMAELYWAYSDEVNPACFARASMSIPFFFHPFRVDHCPQDKAKWNALADYNGSLPDSVMFIDGGIMSNFPINVFHQPYRVPTSPTFGAKIGADREQPAMISKPSQLLSAVFDAARHTLDFDFISRNPDYEHLVAMIDTGDHNWLNFSMEDRDKVDLFARGAKAAADFLRTFNWTKYKTIRKGIADAFLASYNNNDVSAAMSGKGHRIGALSTP
ncbi:MAG: patatin-like phospholipase family protein [Nitrospira sp.]